MRLLLFLLPFALLSSAGHAAADPTFKVYVRDDGAYAVTFEDLEAAGWTGGAVPSAELGLSSRGRPVAIHVRDGGDGAFGRGDVVEFVGEHLAGTSTWYAQETAWAIYFLKLSGGGPRLFAGGPLRRAQCPLRTEQHLEEDRLLLRFGPQTDAADPWLWARLSFFEQDRLEIPLDLTALDRRAGVPLRVRVELRGWSNPRLPVGVADHVVVAQLDGVEVGQVNFQDQQLATLELELDPLQVGERPKLLLTSPERKAEDGNPIVDVSLVNWIQLEYPRVNRLAAGQARVAVRGEEGCREVELAANPGQSVTVLAGGSRVQAVTPASGRVAVRLGAKERVLWAVLGANFERPEVVEIDHPSDLKARARQVDYLMVTHPTLRDAIEPLAQLHRSRGLRVEVVGVDDIYDEFSSGHADPKAIRDFVAWTRSQWLAPTPRFVLLVGDASWDARNNEVDDSRYADWTWRPEERREFVKNSSTPHPSRPTLGHRNLVPTYRWPSSEGHAAADNYFVDLDDDEVPELAIGRFPVTEPEEVRGIVEKIRRYVAAAPLGPWRRDVLWIANDEKVYQNYTDALVERVGSSGYGGERVYPKPEESDNALHQGVLREAFDDGKLLVHFVGHGGRYIWRTGAPDVAKNHDLFTLDDVDSLVPNERLPVVLSMTCYSAPFDHPSADSIGERFLRLGDRGAIAVLAASWRLAPTQRQSETLLDELLRQPTIGEALVATKATQVGRSFRMMFNLLGDPALPLAKPADVLEPEVVDGELRVEIPWRVGATKLVVDVRGADGVLLSSDELDTSQRRVRWPLPDPAAAHEVAVYAWDNERHRDGVGSVRLVELVIPGKPPAVRHVVP